MFALMNIIRDFANNKTKRVVQVCCRHKAEQQGMARGDGGQTGYEQRERLPEGSFF